MAKAVRFSSRANALFAALLLAGCAHSARDLPPDMSNLTPVQRLLPGDTSTPEYSMSCSALKDELVTTRAALSRSESQLQNTQDENQSKGMAGVLVFTPVMLAMEDDPSAITRYRELDVKRERLIRIAQAHQCPI